MINFETKYGYFTEDGREFVITDYKTPKPWINVISNGNYGLIVSQVNGGFSWLDNSNLNRITRWQQDLVQDNWGKYFYLRDESSELFWSPTVKPLLDPPDEYSCTHGVGYSKFNSLKNLIETDLRVFIPNDQNLEIWTIQIQNRDSKPRQISIFTYLEWCLGIAPDNHREFHKSFIETEYDAKNNSIIASKRLWEIPSKRGHWNSEWPYVAYFACNERIDDIDTNKESFIGNLQDLTKPVAVLSGKMSGSVGKWNDSIASMKKTVTLQPGEQRILHFFLGVQKDKSEIHTILKKFQSDDTIENEYNNVIDSWEEICNKTFIETPDAAMNIMTNYWLKYQTISGRLRGRAAYYQQSGAYGFRDQLQDSQIYLYSDPSLTKKQIVLHAEHQFYEGHVLHWWHSISEEGLDAGMSDDLLWLPFLIIQYIKETADWFFLLEEVSYYKSTNKGSILSHCLKSIDLVLERLSSNGLPLILAGDWNDGLSAVGLDKKGESVWLAHFLYYILTEMNVILEHEDKSDKATYYIETAEKLKRVINNLCWDGKWYWRARRDDGQLIGSKINKHGRIFLNPQTWSIIAGTADDNRKTIVMESIKKMLESDFGPLLLYPAYSDSDKYIGYLSRYAPGIRENGGVYTHAATWSIWAAALIGDSDTAYRIYKKLSPIYNGQKPDRYMAEPYVTSGNIDGPDSPYYGRGGWSWYTGSSGWLFRVTVDYILGIRADYDGLIIDPCFHSQWEMIKINRYFRGVEYYIKIVNAGDMTGDELEIWVNEDKISGNKIPLYTNVNRVDVLVKRFVPATKKISVT
jgi:cellobiose phosphorylase